MKKEITLQNAIEYTYSEENKQQTKNNLLFKIVNHLNEKYKDSIITLVSNDAVNIEGSDKNTKNIIKDLEAMGFFK